MEWQIQGCNPAFRPWRQGIDRRGCQPVSGSSDLYEWEGRVPSSSINFVTCHDGFTLYDLVSYNGKHNEANGEDNRDGNNDISVRTAAPRERRAIQKSFLCATSRPGNFNGHSPFEPGVPMIQSGDEVLRTQRGNNNGYCQDNELSWFDWTLTKKNREMLRFLTKMIAFRKRHPCLMRKHFLTARKRRKFLSLM